MAGSLYVDLSFSFLTQDNDYCFSPIAAAGTRAGGGHRTCRDAGLPRGRRCARFQHRLQGEKALFVCKGAAGGEGNGFII